jgi:collagenase-like PrtC family protease
MGLSPYRQDALVAESETTLSEADRATTRDELDLLAPAGDFAALQAALDAGASAVYFGLTSLNARRRARNFRQEEFARAVQAAHARGAKAYLTLNIDLAERELGQAARILELARRCGADAVLVRDPALLALRPEYPELPFHFSTQTAMTSSADVAAAGELGAARVVLARELSLAEIAACSAVPGVQTEVFVQGALCFSISGRCLLSSWVGGRSGNRGTCTSPCRVPWQVEGQEAGTPFSMRDLAAIHRLEDLRRAGVAALKIEGRLKNAAWVGRAVGLYRRALRGENPEDLLRQAEDLGAYTGRMLTCGYLDGRREQLTGLAGREPAAGAPAEENPETPETAEEGGPEVGASFDLQITVEEKAVACRCQCGGKTAQWSLPKTAIRRAHKAVSVADLLDRLAAEPLPGCRLGQTATNDPGFLLVPRAANALVERIAAVIRRARKTPDEQVRIELPDSVRARLEKRPRSAANGRSLGQQPDRVRLEAKAVGAFLRHVRPGGVIVDGVVAGKVEKLAALCGGVPLVVALPPVFFEDDTTALQQLLRQCARLGAAVEVNSWGGWRLAKAAGVRMESGPGLPVLNSLAAQVLAHSGVQCVTLSPEADRRQLEELSAHCPVPCSLVVCGRPALLTTRVQLPADEMAGKTFEDRRGVRLLPRVENGLWVFRPAEGFELRGCRNDRIRVHHLVADLVAAPDPVQQWRQPPLPGEQTFRFNYDRSLA